ncbi:metabolite traffic protein EboE [Spirosoma foliorum]|uniref:Metabolite traffic protein EboE n=1 Tax=Spirosoma foliorum TaxID=2710596 RepID=A0A7G5GVR2_9BACT|nr:metabolite traffic protein EboE [Spirosoma foliorum]QMW02954.1 metabolite traffic protein EboE [Spirosoma foliorum]
MNNLALGHLGYCTNIHAGETWADHFASLQKAIPELKKRLSPDAPFGIGLRLSNIASEELELPENLIAFQHWLANNECYVFTMNGFPFGGFHNTVVKDQVHAPDWTTEARVEYTKRLFRILSVLLPVDELGNAIQGGISTSPLSYRYWFEWDQPAARDYIFSQTTQNILEVVADLMRLRQQTDRLMHLDLEPEPDGLIETTDEFITWFTDYLLPMGIDQISEQFGLTDEQAETAICEHVRLCFDVCHVAVGYEKPAEVLAKLKDYGLRVGKVQISAALKAEFPEPGSRSTAEGREIVKQAFAQFNEPTYLHQVVARTRSGELLRFADLPEALAAFDDNHVEWRAHFHVPIFISEYGVLKSTQDDIQTVLNLQATNKFTNQMEVETYTWDVLPADLKLGLVDSIDREMKWVYKSIGAARADE